MNVDKIIICRISYLPVFLRVGSRSRITRHANDPSDWSPSFSSTTF